MKLCKLGWHKPEIKKVIFCPYGINHIYASRCVNCNEPSFEWHYRLNHFSISPFALQAYIDWRDGKADNVVKLKVVKK
jgi:hypothetical protein